MFHGYLELNGVELVNHERFDAYIAKQIPGALSWFDDPDDNGDLRLALGDAPYSSPMVDGAPWLDPGDPASQRFYGCYWVSEGGFGDSTRTGNVTESLGPGGTVGPVRLATGQFTASLLLVAADEEAMESGVTWLRNALDPGCADCTSGVLEYLLAAPRETYEFDSAGAGDGEGFASLNAANSPMTFSPRVQPDLATCAYWYLVDATITQDVQVQMWVINDGQRENDSGPVWLRRTNWSPNPDFAVNTDSWVATDNGVLSRQADGDTGNAGRFTVTDPAAAWAMTQTIDAKPFMRTLSIDLRADVPGTISVQVDGMAAPVEIQVGIVWERIALPMTKNATSMVISGAADAGLAYLEVRRELIEEGTSERPFFDASTPVDAGYTAIWMGLPGLSPSRLSYDQTLLGGRSVIRPGKVATSFLNVLSGQIDSGISGAGLSFVDATQWVDRVTRQVLRTKATSGPTLSQKLNTRDCGAARIYNVVFTTGKPYAFTLPSLKLNILDSFIPIDDRGVVEALNLVPNPKMALDLFGVDAYFGFDGFGDLTRAAFGGGTAFGAQMTWTQAPSGFDDPSLDLTGVVPWTASPDATDDIPFAVQAVLGGTLNQAGVRLRLNFYDFNGDLIPELGATFTGTGAAWERVSGTYSLPAADLYRVYGTSLSILPAVGASISVGDTLLYSLAMLSPGVASVPTYFDGDTVPVDPAVTAYGWRGEANKSSSTQVLLAPCPAGSPTPVVDPNCDPIPAPPRPPVINLLCAPDDGITSWDRYFVSVPAEQVAANATTVPVLSITSQGGEQRVMRVRMFANPFNYDPSLVDPCSYCGEFIISYLPQDAVLTVDGRTREATINVGGTGEQQAGPLLFGTGGGPMVWPELSCGIPYVLAVDMPAGSDPGAILFSMGLVRRE